MHALALYFELALGDDGPRITERNLFGLEPGRHAGRDRIGHLMREQRGGRVAFGWPCFNNFSPARNSSVTSRAVARLERVTGDTGVEVAKRKLLAIRKNVLR